MKIGELFFCSLWNFWSLCALFVQELIAVIWSPKCGAINIFCRTWRKKFRQKIQKHLPSSIKRQLSKDSILFLGVGIFLRWVDEAKFRKFHRQKIIKTIFLLHYKNSWHFYYFFLLIRKCKCIRCTLNEKVIQRFYTALGSIQVLKHIVVIPYWL